MSSRIVSALLLGFALLSGAAALTYEVVFFRSLGLVFGVASHAVAAVVGAFLFGLGLGAWLGGRWLERFRPLRAYATVELGIAAFGFAAPTLLRSARGLVERGEFNPPSPLIALLGAFVVLAWPTMCMGATFPLLGRALQSTKTNAGVSERIGWLYGINTLGACGGVLLAAYFLLPRFGLSQSTYIAATANTLIALAALALVPFLRTARHAETREEIRAKSSSATSADAALTFASAESVDASPVLALPSSTLLLGSVAALGWSSIALQVLSNRLISSLLGGTVYVFAAIVAVFLLGIASGGAVGGRLADRTPAPTRLLALFAVGFAAAVGIGLRWLAARTGGDDLLAGPDGIGLLEPGERLTVFSPWRYLRITFELSFIALFGATFLSGAFFPAALRLARGARTNLGVTIGRVYLWNTLGSIVGSVLASFVLLPMLGLRGGVALTMVLALSFGLALWRGGTQLGERGFGPAMIVALLAAALGFASLLPGIPPGERDGLRTIFVQESAASAAKVQEFTDAAEEGAIRNLRVNGKTVASSIFIDRRLQYLLGFVSVLAHDDPRSMVCIGLGTGMTSAAMAVAGGELVVVEISPAVIEAARRFEAWNAALHAREDVDIVNDDGRAWLARTEERFDVISADPIDPCVSGSAYLYTQEYYELGRARLAPGGIMSQWIPLYDLAPSDVAGIVLTFRRVFPHATAWVTGYDMMLIGRDTPLQLDPARIEERMSDPTLRAMLADIGIESADELIGCCFAGEGTLERFAATADRPNTDEDPWIEFHAPMSSFGTYPLDVYRVLASGDDPPPLFEGVGSSVKRSVLNQRRRLQQGALEFVQSIEAGRGYGVSRNAYIEFLRAD